MTNPYSPYHQWEATGVSGYPLRYPIVGQSSFYFKLKTFLRQVATPDNQFAHVFAVVAPWGVGKSRLGYEVIAQANDMSPGWKIRNQDGDLVNAHLFDQPKEREQYLALYIRYSQIAHEKLNLDNWFAPGLYKALLPLALGKFDRSIQHQVAEQAYNRLVLVKGFDPHELAVALELGKHDDPDFIYADTALATQLCNNAFAVLQDYGINYVLVILDELETAVERASAGLAAEDRAMDGKEIKLFRKAVETVDELDIQNFSKAIKEEDARARFPWLRYVALCSPAIGDELKEVESTNRRFEIIDLDPNAFADVSAFVNGLAEEGQLLKSYPQGLVEAAYMMSGGNFGWFNVVMSAVDQALTQITDPQPTLREIFQRAIDCSERIGRFVLDRRSVDDDLNLPLELQNVAKELLYGQQPRHCSSLGENIVHQLLEARNSFGEAITIEYQKVEWRLDTCSQILIQNRCQREGGTGDWIVPGIPESINLEYLLNDLATLTVHEVQAKGKRGEYILLLPKTLAGFLQLMDLIHPHPAVEEVGRFLWVGLIAEGTANASVTHVGPSVEMLRRLDIRLRKASTDAIFRNPTENQAYRGVMERLKFGEGDRRLHLLTGILRLLDENWNYNLTLTDLGDDILAIRTDKNGLIEFMGLALHPKKQVIFAWARTDGELRQFLTRVAEIQRKEGCIPVLVFTSSYELIERAEKSREPYLEKARQYAKLINLNSGEINALEEIGLPQEYWDNFRLREEGFTTKFAQRLNRIRGILARQIHDWRHQLSQEGRIAWPVRPNGTLKQETRDVLIDHWKKVIVEHNGCSLDMLGSNPNLNWELLLPAIDSLDLSPKSGPKGYSLPDDGAMFWVGKREQAIPEIPPFLVYGIIRWLDKIKPSLSFQDAKDNWFWGYLWDGNRPNIIFEQWIKIASELVWITHRDKYVDASTKQENYYELISVEQLEGELQAAQNYLEQDYPEIYENLLGIFGEGVIDNKLKPGTGTKYLWAKDQLKQAKQCLEQLKLQTVPSKSENWQVLRAWFKESTKLRIQIRKYTDSVFHPNQKSTLSYEQLDPRIDLDDNSKPLWERVNQAETFANKVKEVASRIRDRTEKLCEQITAEVNPEKNEIRFPRELFTRPLYKINSIVDAGMTGKDPLTTTQRVQNAQAETLAYFLRDLRTKEAFDTLSKLGREVGVSLQSAIDLPRSEITGEILSSLNKLQTRYNNFTEKIVELQHRLSHLQQAISNAPKDFSSPPLTPALKDLLTQPDTLSYDLEAILQDDVEELLSKHDSSLKLGNFSPLMNEALQRLLGPSEDSLSILEGHVRSWENKVVQYRDQLEQEVATSSVLRAYKKLVGVSPVSLPQFLENLRQINSLREAKMALLGAEVLWRQEATQVLATTDVSFEEWISVVDNLSKPPLSSEKLEQLVNQGFLIRTYGLPGKEV